MLQIEPRTITTEYTLPGKFQNKLKGSPSIELYQKRTYTIEDIYALPKGQRAELIGGQIYDMAPPVREHQKLVSQFTWIIGKVVELR